MDATLPTTRPTTARWWKILAVGVALLTSTIVAATIVGDVSEGWWLVLMAGLLSGIVTIAAGLVVGVAHLTADRRHAE